MKSKTLPSPSSPFDNLTITDFKLGKPISLRLPRSTAGGIASMALHGDNEDGQKIRAVEMGKAGSGKAGGKAGLGNTRKKVEDLSELGLANRNQGKAAGDKRRAAGAIRQQRHRDKLKAAKEAAMKAAI